VRYVGGRTRVVRLGIRRGRHRISVVALNAKGKKLAAATRRFRMTAGLTPIS